jgi:hypothetical protein
LAVQFDNLGNIQSVENKETGQHTQIAQQYRYYIGSVGDAVSGQKSGAYPHFSLLFNFFPVILAFLNCI